jgi:hypothetical protein
MKLEWLKKIAPWLGVVVVLALLYDGYIFYSRWSEKHEEERVRAQQEAVLAKKTLNLLGNGDLKITSFYALPGAIKKGAAANVCYGVTGAKTLHIDPPVAEVWPSMNHCLQVTPVKDTQYKLTAEDAGGHSVSESFLLQVLP